MADGIRNRIIEYKNVPVDQLKPHPKNWRIHPQNQRTALTGVLDEIGYADALKVRAIDDGYEIIDGHLRADVVDNGEVPVLVLDVTEEEAGKLLLTLDPLAGMAMTDDVALQELLATIEFQNEDIGLLIEHLSQSTDNDDVSINPPESFEEFGDDIETSYKCPSCEYEWSGSPTP
tara:strand:+ start:40 stop:564 length:525 start_codon:yes stop_codon:yes gene_type:complete